MPGGPGWRLCLFALILSVGRPISGDLNKGDADSRSGYLMDLLNMESEEFDDDNFDHTTSYDRLPDLLNGIARNEIFPGPHVQEPMISGYAGPDTRNEIVLPRFPTDKERVDTNKYPLKDLGTQTPNLSRYSFTSRVIPSSEYILLHNIPDGHQILTCSREGELHHVWSPGFQCFVCACFNHYGRLRPVCASCSTCLAPEPSPPSPPKPDKNKSCKPLPTGIPFQSPLDPCQICICTERTDLWGENDVNIQCQHNPQCVTQPSTQSPYPTPIPPRPVCDKYPQDVPFPHPHDPCQSCKCTETLSPYGLPEQRIRCVIIPECRPQPTTIAPLEPEICDQHPLDIYFQHPFDQCRMCKCVSNPLSFIKKRMVCYVVESCFMQPSKRPPPPPPSPPGPVCDNFPKNIPFPHPQDPCQSCICTVSLSLKGLAEQRFSCEVIPECQPQPPVPHPTTIAPLEPEICDQHPLDIYFQHPFDQCQMCKCVSNPLSFIKKRMVCYVVESCLSPSTSSTPQPENAKCAPLPVDEPFQNPMNPCQICICTERRDIYGKVDVHIDCQENEKCVLPPDATTIPPHPISPVPWSLCGKFPENVHFPHPKDICQVCKCTVYNDMGVPLPHISCITKPDCAATTVPPTYSTLKPELTTKSKPLPPQPENARCVPLPVGIPFQNPLNPCQICICSEQLDIYGRIDVQIDCQENPQCVLPPETSTLPSIVTPVPMPACGEFPENVYFPHPSDICQLCQCSLQINKHGLPESYINCFTKPECLTTPVPDVTTPEIPLSTPETETITTYPPPTEICDHYLSEVSFQHPKDRCQICKCIDNPNIFINKKKIICHVITDCLEPKPPSTMPPQPKNVKCAPLPVDIPFQNPLNPCQICVCTEQLDLFGRIDVKIDCQENLQCVLPPDSTTLPPIVTPIPLPACGEFPENVYFPHPEDVCRVCKCSVLVNAYGIPEPHINCYAKPDCLEPKPSTTTPSTLPPQPKNAKCAPLPVDIPFQNPLNPCQICICTEQLDWFGRIDVQIHCQENLQCVLPPDSTTLPPIVTPIPLPACGQFPENVYFPHPEDVCRVCKCSVLVNAYGISEPHINCYAKPDCLEPRPSTTTPRTLPPQPKNVKCAPLPVDIPFQNPMNPCQICVCTEQLDVFGRIDVHIECQENRQCVLPPDSTTLPPIVTPIPLPACGEFPENVYFPHPADVCQVCKCYVPINTYGIPEPHINCYTKPDCLTPTTSVATPTLPTISTLPPQPKNAKCAPLPVDVPFQNPLNPCQICICTEQLDMFGRIDVQIHCQENLQCVLPPDSTTLPPIVTPIPLPACGEFPENVYFPHPEDVCQVCKCYVPINTYGIPEPHINCYTKPDCLNPRTSEATPTISTLPPQPKNARCAPLPVEVPFPNPMNPCQICICIERSDVFGENNVQIECQENPQCVLPPDSTTLPPIVTPVPLPACGQFPENVYFPHPDNICDVCKCSLLTNVIGIPEPHISCFTKPECLPTPRPTPDAMELIVKCAPLPLAKPFPNPLNPCQTCICDEQVDLFGRVEVQIKCEENADCIAPPDVPYLPPYIIEPINFPGCTAFPVNVPFPHPKNSCQLCKCSRETSLVGYKQPVISCISLPECQPTAQPITVQPSTFEPITLPTELPQPHPRDICVYHPINVPFTHPSDMCQICICYGAVPSQLPGQLVSVPAERIYKCILKPNCYSPEVSPVTQATPPYSPLPDKAYCEPLPKNTPFQSPLDPCQICICLETIDLVGRPDVIIKCQENPQCVSQPTTLPSTSTPISTTPSPWPPTPRGPLPGPFPHESCRPYVPNKAFQHPWDDCQVCLCREHVSMERTTIEVNCYTKPSCCIELPLDFPGAGGISSSGPIVIGANSGEGKNIGYYPGDNTAKAPGGYIPGHYSENVYTNLPNEHLIGPPNGNVIASQGWNAGYLTGPYSENLSASSSTNLNQKWNGPEPWHSSFIDVEKNKNLQPSDAYLPDLSNDKYFIGANGLKWTPNGGINSKLRPFDEKLVGSDGIQWTWPPNGQLIDSQSEPFNGNLNEYNGIKWSDRSKLIASKWNLSPYGHYINSQNIYPDVRINGPGSIKWIWPQNGELINTETDYNLIGPNGIKWNMNKVLHEDSFNNPGGNSYVPNNLLHRMPVTYPIVNDQWRIKNLLASELLYPPQRPYSTHSSLVVPGEQLYGSIGYNEGEHSVYRHDGLVNPGELAVLGSNAKPKSQVILNPKTKLRMRTKSGKPTDGSDSLEYD